MTGEIWRQTPVVLKLRGPGADLTGMRKVVWSGVRVATLALVAVLAVPVGFSSPAVAADGVLGLSPGSGPSGTSVSASGDGFPRKTTGTLNFDGAGVATVRTNKAGAFSVTFTVPETPPGTYPVTAWVGDVTATGSFTVSGTAQASTTTTVPASSIPPGGPAPQHVVATQGPTDPGALSVMVTWDRSDPAASGYDVLRNGAVVATVAVVGDAWDDLDFTDTALTAGTSYDYAVRARYPDGSAGALSAPYRVVVRSDAQLGSGRVFSVDGYVGTDRQRAQQAVDAARAAGGGVVLFGARTYTFDGTLNLAQTNNVVLRGAGTDSTFIQPSFAGETASCGTGGQLLNLTGSQSTMATRLTAPVAVGQRTVNVDSTTAVTAGQVIVLYEPPPVANATSAQNAAAGVVQDPGTGADERHRWDANEIVAVDSVARTVTFKYPWSQSYSTAVPWARITSGIGNGVERLTLQGRSATESTYYSLVLLSNQARFSMADVQGRWANRNYLRTSGYDIRVVGFRGLVGDTDGGNSTTPCKYKFSVWRTSNFTFVGGQLGEATHDANQSFITFQRSQRVLVRNSRFGRSRSYAFNEHGAGSRHWVFENNHVAVGPTATHGAIRVGHADFGFTGPGIIRNNTFETNPRDVWITENSYEVRILDNVMRNTTERVVTAWGWAGPGTAVDLHGSLRLTIARNTVVGAKADGFVLGEARSGHYPYLGVKDVVIEGNALDVVGVAVRLDGDSTATRRYQVRNNTGKASYVRPPFVVGDHWEGNADGVVYGTPVSTPWAQPSFAWEAVDRS